MGTPQTPDDLKSWIKNQTAPPGTLYTPKSRAYLTFDDTIEQTVSREFRMPDEYVSGLKIIVQYSMATDITNNVSLRSEIMAATIGDNILTDSYDTRDDSADDVVPGTLNDMKEITHTITNLDGLAGGDYFAIILGRNVTTTGTNASNAMFWWSITHEYTT